MLLFRSEQHVDRWCKQWNRPRGGILSLQQGCRLAKEWYGDRLSPAWRPKKRIGGGGRLRTDWTQRGVLETVGLKADAHDMIQIRHERLQTANPRIAAFGSHLSGRIVLVQ